MTFLLSPYILLSFKARLTGKNHCFPGSYFFFTTILHLTSPECFTDVFSAWCSISKVPLTVFSTADLSGAGNPGAIHSCSRGLEIFRPGLFPHLHLLPWKTVRRVNIHTSSVTLRTSLLPWFHYHIFRNHYPGCLQKPQLPHSSFLTNF